MFYFVEGFKEAADKFQKESGVQPMVDLEQLDERIKIREAIQEGRIQDAISLVNSIQPELLDNDRYLYFRLQVMLSYIKQGYGSKEEYDGVFSMCYFEVMICISLFISEFEIPVHGLFNSCTNRYMYMDSF